MMTNNRLFIGGLVGLFLIALSACGSAAQSGGGGGGTSTGGPVSIRTDHSTYTPGGSIQVSVVNNLSTSIFVYDTRASCSILDLQMQVNGVWKSTTVARCPLGRPAQRVEIAAGKTYSATIQAGYPGLYQAQFPAGAYRLVLNYSTSATASPVGQNTTTVYSATFSVTSSS